MSLNDVFKALSDSSRRKILSLLRDGDMTAGEIAAQFEMTNASISSHLKILHQADLLYREKRGQHVIYSLNTTVFQDMMKWIMDLNKEEK
ncbi:ArsR family transcriptional regulator [Paenibacillaceae bacterium]|nr:ArsR family transcriptional regulator [Paenibacillaceae bacterium]